MPDGSRTTGKHIREMAKSKSCTSMNREEVFNKIIEVLKSQGAKKIAVFGSYSRGEEQPDSNIDIIVEFSGRKSLLELVSIERELSEVLGIKVDLLTEKSISPYLLDVIMEEMKEFVDNYLVQDVLQDKFKQLDGMNIHLIKYLKNPIS